VSDLPTTDLQALDLLMSLEHNASQIPAAEDWDSSELVNLAMKSREQIKRLNKVLTDPAFPVRDERRGEMRKRLDDATRTVLRSAFGLDEESINTIINGPRGADA
jgi:hypothetical protein